MLKDILFPRFCLGCGFLGSYICLDCQKKLIYLKQDKCLYCKKQSPFGLTHENCKKEYGLDSCMSFLYYNDFLKKIIKAIKYRLATEVLNDLFLVLKPEEIIKINFFRKINKEIFIQPVPLHPQKLKERGFNQAQLLTNFFNNFIYSKITDDLIRKKTTLAQAQLKKRRERYSNLRGAFKTNKQVTGKSYILVDDVLTTGITMAEAGKALKKAGAKAVFALSLAKG